MDPAPAVPALWGDSPVLLVGPGPRAFSALDHFLGYKKAP